MTRYRLRYQSSDLEMPTGEFVVGRSSSCHLAIQDAMVSRRHARFLVEATRVSVEDLGSRNGVLVNGERIEGPFVLRHMDRVVIGSQELVFMTGEESPAALHRPTLSGMTLELKKIDRPELEEETTTTGAESVLDNLVEKSMTLGRFEEAERLLARKLDTVLKAAQNGEATEIERMRIYVGYALALAGGLKKTTWVDWVFDLHGANSRLIDEEWLERLHNLVRQIRYSGGPAFSSYLEKMRARADSLNASEKFRLKRLEGIERMVGA